MIFQPHVVPNSYIRRSASVVENRHSMDNSVYRSYDKEMTALCSRNSGGNEEGNTSVAGNSQQRVSTEYGLRILPTKPSFINVSDIMFLHLSEANLASEVIYCFT